MLNFSRIDGSPVVDVTEAEQASMTRHEEEIETLQRCLIARPVCSLDLIINNSAFRRNREVANSNSADAQTSFLSKPP